MSKTNGLTWSFSSYNLDQRCPAAWKYRYIDRLPDPSGPAAQRGTDIHLAAENYVRGKTSELPPDIERWRTELDRLFALQHKQCELKLGLTRHMEPCEYDEAWFKARLDVCGILPHAFFLADYKTGGRKEWHADQIESQAMILMLHVDEIQHLKGQLWYLDSPPHYGISSEDFHRKQLKGMVKKWKDRGAFILSQREYHPNPEGRACGYCNFSSRKGGPCKY